MDDQEYAQSFRVRNKGKEMIWRVLTVVFAILALYLWFTKDPVLPPSNNEKKVVQLEHEVAALKDSLDAGADNEKRLKEELKEVKQQQQQTKETYERTNAALQETVKKQRREAQPYIEQHKEVANLVAALDSVHRMDSARIEQLNFEKLHLDSAYTRLQVQFDAQLTFAKQAIAKLDTSNQLLRQDNAALKSENSKLKRRNVLTKVVTAVAVAAVVAWQFLIDKN
jgi:septal ring factor EnvC (AmiA/AmiB activator)